MKKAILGLAFLSIAAVSVSASAQKKCDKPCAANTECVANKQECCKVKNKECRKANLFEGIQLTTEQKSKIEALDNAVKVSRQELKAKAKTAKDKKDSSYNPRQARKELRGKYINDLGEILTSDQMTVYLKNFYVNSGSHHGGKKAFAMKHGKGGKFNKDGKSGRQGKAPRQMQSANK